MNNLLLYALALPCPRLHELLSLARMLSSTCSSEVRYSLLFLQSGVDPVSESRRRGLDLVLGLANVPVWVVQMLHAHMHAGAVAVAPSGRDLGSQLVEELALDVLQAFGDPVQLQVLWRVGFTCLSRQGV